MFIFVLLSVTAIYGPVTVTFQAETLDQCRRLERSVLRATEDYRITLKESCHEAPPATTP